MLVTLDTLTFTGADGDSVDTCMYIMCICVRVRVRVCVRVCMRVCVCDNQRHNYRCTYSTCMFHVQV